MRSASIAVSTLVRGFEPPGYREALRRRTTLPDVAQLAAALDTREGRFCCSPRALRRSFDQVFEALRPARRHRLDRRAAAAQADPIPKGWWTRSRRNEVRFDTNQQSSSCYPQPRKVIHRVIPSFGGYLGRKARRCENVR